MKCHKLKFLWICLCLFSVFFFLLSCQSLVQVKQYKSLSKVASLISQPSGQQKGLPIQEITYNDSRPVKENETKVSFKVSYDLLGIKSSQPPLSNGVMKLVDFKTQALPSTTITKIEVIITGLGITPVTTPIDISGTPGQFLNININLNVPIGKRRIITVKGFTGAIAVPGAELKAVFDVPVAGVVNVDWNSTPVAGVYQELLNKNTIKSKLSIEAISINDMTNFINTIPVGHKYLINVQKVVDSIVNLNAGESFTGNLAQIPTDGLTNADYKINTTNTTIKVKDKSTNNLSGIQVLVTDPVSGIPPVSDATGQATINSIPPGTWRGQIKLSGTVVKEDDVTVDANLNVTLSPIISGDVVLDWWHTDWGYRKTIEITNGGGAILTDYQILMTLDTSVLITSGKMKNDGGDIRIIDSDWNQLNYWIEDGTINTANTKIWVKIPSIPVGLKTIYLYYGNPSANSASNKDNTFILSDDFPGIALNLTKWATYIDNPNSWVEVNDEARLFLKQAWDHTGAGIYTINTFNKDNGIAIDYVLGSPIHFPSSNCGGPGNDCGFHQAWVRPQICNRDTAWYGGPVCTSINLSIRSNSGNLKFYFSGGSIYTGTTSWDYGPFTTDVSFKISFRFISSEKRVIILVDGIERLNATVDAASWNTIGTSNVLEFYNGNYYDGDEPTSYEKIDNVVIRKYVSPEPIINVGTEIIK